MLPGYDAAFAAFLLFTNEKEELYAEISRRIEKAGAKSLLDIGAGGGQLAYPLSSLVERYVAVEQKETYAALLRAAGLRVIESSFPTVIDEPPFDMVLVSHALPREPTKQEPFLRSAWHTVAPGGSLLGITYDDVQSEWWNFLSACGLGESRNSDESRIRKLLMYFSTLGPTLLSAELSTVTATVSTASKSGIVSALSFVYGDGREEKEREFEERSSIILQYLDVHHRDGEEYCFPFHHIFLQARKMV